MLPTWDDSTVNTHSHTVHGAGDESFFKPGEHILPSVTISHGRELQYDGSALIDTEVGRKGLVTA